MDDLPTKSKKRAMRRKRNLIAKELRTNKLYSPKTIELKRVRKKLSVREIYDDEDIEFDGMDRKIL